MRAVEGRLLRFGPGDVHVREDGPPDGSETAPAVLLLHGYASSLRVFDAMVPLLRNDFRVIRVDLLGHGSSAGNVSAYDSSAQAAMVAALLHHLRIGPVAVLGHSFGADVAVGVAELHWQVDRLVVVGQAPDYAAARIPRGASILARPVVGRLARRVAPLSAVRRSARFAFAPQARRGDWGRLVQDFRAMTPAVHRAVVVDRPRRLARRPLDERIAALGGPTLVILGERDQLYPVEATRTRYAAVPNVRVEVLAGSGHSPVLEQPGETARLLRAFLEPGDRAD